MASIGDVSAAIDRLLAGRKAESGRGLGAGSGSRMLTIQIGAIPALEEVDERRRNPLIPGIQSRIL
jgi:hypothetical protein